MNKRKVPPSGSTEKEISLDFKQAFHFKQNLVDHFCHKPKNENEVYHRIT